MAELRIIRDDLSATLSGDSSPAWQSWWTLDVRVGTGSGTTFAGSTMTGASWEVLVKESGKWGGGEVLTGASVPAVIGTGSAPIYRFVLPMASEYLNGLFAAAPDRDPVAAHVEVTFFLDGKSYPSKSVPITIRNRQNHGDAIVAEEPVVTVPAIVTVRGGTAAEIGGMIPEANEIVVTTDTNTIRRGDGEAFGGHILGGDGGGLVSFDRGIGDGTLSDGATLGGTGGGGAGLAFLAEPITFEPDKMTEVTYWLVFNGDSEGTGYLQYHTTGFSSADVLIFETRVKDHDDGRENGFNYFFFGNVASQHAWNPPMNMAAEVVRLRLRVYRRSTGAVTHSITAHIGEPPVVIDRAVRAVRVANLPAVA
jgi:hypothetical protein